MDRTVILNWVETDILLKVERANNETFLHVDVSEEVVTSKRSNYSLNGAMPKVRKDPFVNEK